MYYAQWCILKLSYSEGFYRQIFTEFQIFNIIAILNNCFFLVAASSTLALPKGETWSAGLLAERVVRARNLLYVGSLFLTIAIVFEASFYSWLGSLIKDGDISSNYRSQNIGILIYHGIWYTLTLLSIFIPLDRLFSKRARELAEAAEPSGTAKTWAEWAQEHGMAIFGRGSAYRVLGALSPVLTSAATVFVKAIIEKVT
jgi:hypothetical protein